MATWDTNSVAITFCEVLFVENEQLHSFTALSPWEDSEIRRRDNVFDMKYEVVAKSDYHVREYAPNVTNIEISITMGECLT